MIIPKDQFKKSFENLINRHDEFAIVPHFNPDPDALGSAFGIHFLLSKLFEKKANIYFSGIIGRAQNIKMIQVLDIPIINLKNDERLPELPMILLDTQPGTGNNPLHSKEHLKIVIDHHPVQESTKRVPYADIRLDYGSTCTMVYDYLREYGLKPSVNIATALYYGIKTDIVGEGRMGFKVDYDAMEDLGQFINSEKLYSIEYPQLPFDYYININKGMENSVVYEDLLITSLGEIDNPDYIGEIADFLIRFDKAQMVLVLGVHGNIIQMSFRSQSKKIDAGMILKKIVGRLGSAGGHVASSGGRIVTQDTAEIPRLTKKLITKALHLLQGKITSGVPFLSMSDYLNLKQAKTVPPK